MPKIYLLALTLCSIILMAPANPDLTPSPCADRPESGRSLYTCQIVENGTAREGFQILLYKEFLGSDKRSYTLLVDSVPESSSCNVLRNAKKSSTDSTTSYKYSGKQRFSIKACKRKNCFTGALRGKGFSALEQFQEPSGEVKLQGLSCRQTHKERN